MKNAGSLGSRIARDAARIDGSAIELGFAIRSTVGVTIVILLSNIFQAPIAGASGALGAVVVGFASRQGVYRTRATAMIITALAMAVTAFAACLTHGNIFASIAIAAAFGFGYGLIAALGPTAITIATNSAVALAIFGSISLSPREAAYQCSFVVAGGLLQTLLLVVLWPFERFSHERTILATAFRSLAAYARSFPSAKLRSPAPETFTKLTDVFADMQPFAKRGEIAAFEALFDETERIRGALAALATEKFLLERRNRTTSVEAIEAAGVAAANVMSEIAGSLASARAPKGDALWDAFEEPLETLAAREDTFSRRAHTDLEALLGQLRSTWRAAFAPAGKEPPESSDEIVAAHVGVLRRACDATREPLTAFGIRATRTAACAGSRRRRPRGASAAVAARVLDRPHRSARAAPGFRHDVLARRRPHRGYACRRGARIADHLLASERPRARHSLDRVRVRELRLHTD